MFDMPVASFIALLVGFGFLIFVHELGHFAVAKAVGIRCTQFAIGFGQSLLTWRKGLGVRVGTTEPEVHRRAAEMLRSEGVKPADEGRDKDLPGGYSPRQIYDAAERLGLGETEYRFNWIPLGGYVKMVGQEDLDPSARSDDPRSFNSKPIWARACVISAGVVMNVIFGLVFFVVAFAMGVDFPSSEVGGTIAGSPAATTYAVGHEGDPAYRGLQVGDRIVRIDDEPVRDLTDVRLATALASPGDTLEFHVEREGHGDLLRYAIEPTTLRDQALMSAGIAPAMTRTVEEVTSSAMEAAGVAPGMEIAAVGGQPVTSMGRFYRLMEASAGQAVEVRFEDPQTGASATVTLQAAPTLVAGEQDQGPSLLGLVPATQVDPVEGEPAAEAGVKTGDLLVKLGPVLWPSPQQVYDTVAEADGAPLSVTVLRDGQAIDLGTVNPNRRGKLGIVLLPAFDEPVIGETLRGSPAAALDLLPPGSRILSVAGQPIANWPDLQRTLQAVVKPGEPTTVQMTVQLNMAGDPVEQHTLQLSAEQASAITAAGWAPSLTGLLFAPSLTTVQVKNPLQAVQVGIEYTHQFIMQTYVTLLRVFQGSLPARELRGPVGIVDAGTKAAEQGWSYLLFFLGLISVNLAVINFLPIPIVDGGLMVFLIIEKIKGSPASAGVQMAAMWIGLALIAAVFLFVTFHDLMRVLGFQA